MKKTASKKTELTQKQKKLVKGIAEGKTQKQAALEAGYSPNNAESIASQELKKPKLVEALNELMDKMGLSDERLLEKHKELLNAQKTISTVSGQSANEKTMDFVDVPDYPVQVKALEMAYKLKGKFVEKHEHSGKLTLEQLIAGDD